MVNELVYNEKHFTVILTSQKLPEAQAKGQESKEYI